MDIKTSKKEFKKIIGRKITKIEIYQKQILIRVDNGLYIEVRLNDFFDPKMEIDVIGPFSPSDFLQYEKWKGKKEKQSSPAG